MTRDEIQAGVRESLSKVLDMDASCVSEDARIIGDLGADSLDLLDLVFQLEQRFSIKISPRDIERRARERLGGAAFEVDGIYTPEALAELRAALPEVPPEELHDGLHAAALPRTFRVATFVNIVARLKEAGHA
ncbi:MAG: acyl carrier protein [Nitrospirae bacterium]|nr:acyl carrier protein [Nitrospirota bacterium]MBI5696148.1 acyl carrier protein [Nitrospirota bacterium]